MAWDTKFNIQWSQRIEKEERAFLAGAKRAAELDDSSPKGSSPGRNRRSSHGSRRHERVPSAGSASPVLQAGGNAMMPRSPSVAGMEGRGTSASSRSSQSRIARSSSEGYLADVPDHLKAIARFPVVDKDLMTARVRPDPDGKVPKIKFQSEEVRALWWPMRGTYTKYHPQFRFEDPPGWTPEDILKVRPKR